MKRRTIVASAIATASTLAIPRVARPQNTRLLKFVPQGDLALLDPIQTPLFVTRNHALMVFDTLYGVDENWQAHPQMVEGHTTEQDGRLWKLTLREGLKFHDGTPVLARDVVASLERWGRKDSFGLAMMGATDEVAATSDRMVEIRLKRPFPLIPDALAKSGPMVAVIMPERLAKAEPTVQVTEMVGSGPYKFVAGERVPGSLAVYERFADYVPRPQGVPSMMSGPKVAHFDRVEWHTIPEAATAAAALQAGEIDWWEQPTPEFWPMLRRNRTIVLDVADKSGSLGFVRFNFLNPPFDKAAVRRVAMAAISQEEVMTAMAGTDHTMWRDKVGYFLPDTPMASDVGLSALSGPVDVERCKQMLAASGYDGEKLVFLVATDYPSVNAEGQVVVDAWTKVGFKVDFIAADGGTVAQRVNNRQSVDKGGWNAFCAYTTGVNTLNPAAHNYIRGSGKTATFGWPDLPRLEELRNRWFDAPDKSTQAAICREMQEVALETVPYVPTGIFYQPTTYSRTLTDVPRGIAQFYGVRRV